MNLTDEQLEELMADYDKMLKEPSGLLIYAESKECRPYRKRLDDAGIDLKAKEDYTIRPGEITTIHTGVYIQPPPTTTALLMPRSSTTDIRLANTIGLIDPNYRGEIMANVICNFDKEVHIEKGQRVFQLLVMPYLVGIFQNVDYEQLDQTTRGGDGFGSSGSK